jgi:ubiquinone biosynthesis protein Coq4
MATTLWQSTAHAAVAPATGTGTGAATHTGGPAIQGPNAPDPLFRILGTMLAMSGGDTSLELVGVLTDGLLATPSYALAAQHLRHDPGCAALIDARWVPGPHDLDRLAGLPVGSLGHAYAASLTRLGYDPDLHAGMEAGSEAAYVEVRLSQTHDLWHVLTGFDTSLLGEIGLQAFHLGQFPYPLGAMLTAQALQSITLFDPEQLPALVQAIHTGLQMGQQARPLFAQRWEEGWEKPLQQWRQELNLTPVPEWATASPPSSGSSAAQPSTPSSATLLPLGAGQP